MTKSFDLVIRGGTLALPSGLVHGDIGVRDGKIAAIGDLARQPAAGVFEAKNLHVLPGAIDTQVHFREPGATHKEDLATGSRAAILGGVTSVFEMPNTNPPTTSRAALDDKLARAKDRMFCDHAFYVGATPENAGELARLEMSPGCSGVKMFMGSSTGNLLVAADDAVSNVLASGKRRVSVHSEDEARLKERKSLARPGQPATHPLWRDELTALRATERLIALAQKHSRRVHVLHVSTAEEMAFLKAHKDLATVETTVNHLTLEAPECYERLGSYAQMNPPVRDARHREAIWRALNEGIVDVIGTDHAPHTRAEKDKPYPESPSGMPGVQTLIPVMLDHVNAGRLTLMRLVELIAHTPQRIWSIVAKGRIEQGCDADFAIVDLKTRRTIENNWIASRCGWTPYHGMRVTGWPVAAILRGHIVMREDAIVAKAEGRPLRFAETEKTKNQ